MVSSTSRSVALTVVLAELPGIHILRDRWYNQHGGISDRWCDNGNRRGDNQCTYLLQTPAGTGGAS